MPSGPFGYRRHVPKTWRTMCRWERKMFHRNNARRISNHLPPLEKP